MDLKVFIASQEVICSECGKNLRRNAWKTLIENKKGLCLSCSDLDHLAFLPSGNAALTLQSGKHSILKAVEFKWSTRRKRCERQGILVEEAAIDQADEDCLSDADIRARRRERDALRREVQRSRRAHSRCK